MLLTLSCARLSASQRDGRGEGAGAQSHLRVTCTCQHVLLGIPAEREGPPGQARAVQLGMRYVPGEVCGCSDEDATEKVGGSKALNIIPTSLDQVESTPLGCAGGH